MGFMEYFQFSSCQFSFSYYISINSNLFRVSAFKVQVHFNQLTSKFTEEIQIGHLIFFLTIQVYRLQFFYKWTKTTLCLLLSTPESMTLNLDSVKGGWGCSNQLTKFPWQHPGPVCLLIAFTRLFFFNCMIIYNCDILQNNH